jgi:N-acetyl sugar amidotransferase
MNESNYQQCTKTVMDNISDPNITFDKDGICNYWHEYKIAADKGVIHGEKGKAKWNATISQIKKEGNSKKYDCIIGVSGGVDSTYIAYLVKKANLSPLVVHFDNGWNSEIAVQNISNIIKYLEADLHTLVIDWNEFRDLQRAYLKAGVVDIEALTDHAIFGTLYKIAAKNNIKYVISGSNIETEELLPKAWIFNKTDPINIADIHNKFGEVELKTYPFFSILKKKYYLKFKKLEYISPINWAPYNKQNIKDIISKEIGWEDYGGKHHESIFTKFYQNYILPEKFKIDKRKAHLSNLICSGQITKAEALKELELPIYNPKELIADKEYVIKKLGFTVEEFYAILKANPKSHSDFKTEGPIENHIPVLKPIKAVYKLFK